MNPGTSAGVSVINVSEGVTVRELHRRAIAIAGVLAGLGLSGVASTADAQQVCRRMPSMEVARLMVPTLRAEDRGLAVEAADALRDRLEREYNCQELIIISRNDIFNSLTASGYDTASALSPNDAKLLGTIVRADEYISGTVAQTDEGFRADLNLVLQRDPALVQPLGRFTGRRLSDIARAATSEIGQARKQIDAESKCVDALRAGNEEQAIQHADFGVQQYPRATLARLCKQAAYEELGFGPDSMLRIANEILEIDPRSRLALHVAAIAYQATGEDQHAVESWTTLVSLDPSNTGLVEQAISYLVTSGNAAAARPIIDEAAAQNPGDPDIQSLRFRVLLTIRDFKAAIVAGEELARTDTSRADSVFFRQLVQAYTADSQPQLAAETAARGVAKFPTNALLHQLHAQNLRTIGQLQQAEQASRRAVESDARIQGGWLQLAQIQNELNQPDSALASLRQGLASGADPAMIAQMASALGGQMYRQASSTKTVEDWERVIPWYELTDSLQTASGTPVPTTRFVLGFAAVNIAQPLLQQAAEERSCEKAQRAQAYLNVAQVKLREGGVANPENAGQLLQWVMQASPAADAQIKAFCQ